MLKSESIAGFEKAATMKKRGLTLTYWKQPSAEPQYNDHERDAITQLRAAARKTRRGK